MPQIDYTKLAAQARQPVDYAALAEQAKMDAQVADAQVADAPSLWERLNTPLLPQIGQAGRAAANFISQPRLDENVPEFLRVPIAMQRGLLAGSLEGAANLVEGFTSPVGLATTAAGLPAARYVAPALVPAVSAAQRLVGGGAGAMFAAEGVRNVATAPTLGEKVAAVPQIAAGLAGVAPAVQRMQARRAALVPRKVDLELSHAFPASHDAPYTQADIAIAVPFALEKHRMRPVTTTLDAIEAFDGGVKAVEQRMDDIIAQFPNVRVRSTARSKITSAMADDVQTGALEKGLKSIKDLPDLNAPASLKRLEAVRLRLNAANKAHLDQNKYDRATARQTDPAFRAREIAAESIRESIYGTLEEQGVPGIADFRRAEGSIIKVRNAAERQHYSGEKVVSGAAPSLKAEIGAAATQAGMTAAGGGLGSLVGMTIPGAITGSVLGQQLGRKIRGHRVVRDELVARAFGRAEKDARVPFMPPVPPLQTPRGLLERGSIPMSAGADPSGRIPSEPFISRVIPRIEAGSAPPSANQAPPRTGGANRPGGSGGIGTMGQIMGDGQVPFNSGTMPLGGIPSRGNAPVQMLSAPSRVLEGEIVGPDYVDATMVSPTTRALPRGVYAMSPSEPSVSVPQTAPEKLAKARQKLAPTVSAANDTSAGAERSFMLRWLANDLEEMPFQQGGSSAGGRRAAYDTLDPEEARGLLFNPRVAGTPTQEMFHAVGIMGSREQIARKLSAAIRGVKSNPKIESLVDAMSEAWDGQRFDWDLVTDETVATLGIRRKDFRSPVTMPLETDMPGMFRKLFNK